MGSYLGEIWTGAAGVNTVPMRVDVEMASTGRSEGDGKGAALTKRIGVWQTFRANEWDNKGEALGEASAEEGLRIDVQVLGVRDVYEQRGGCKLNFFRWKYVYPCADFV